MNRRPLAIAGILSFLLATSVFATQQRSFVSSAGTDANPCSRDLPCRTFAAAIAQTNANGEVVAIDSAGYGAVTVTQSVALIAPLGVHAGISVFSGSGVTVNAPSASVILRNLYINAQGGIMGIQMTDAGNLHVDHCIVTGFTIDIELTPQTANSWVDISDTAVREPNTGTGLYADSGMTVLVALNRCEFARLANGIVVDRAVVSVTDSVIEYAGSASFWARGTGGPATVSLTRCKVFASTYAVRADNGRVDAFEVDATDGGYGFLASASTVNITVTHCASHGMQDGIYATAGSVVNAADSTFADGHNGVLALTGAVVRLTRCTLTGNSTYGIDNVSGTITTTGDNLVDGNGTNSSGTIGPANKM